ncbi:hypothetical protein B0H63DRAFT_489405 [Podospora didyma]|uniref:Uncharacterized protein n=1 Tax=Podospora didyma TaxID=330526 RepID=A0AAE0K021_9PEZI|nr:hypothetical protein B0H63DRAFT_489405 [Podospora didyma]
MQDPNEQYHPEYNQIHQPVAVDGKHARKKVEGNAGYTFARLSPVIFLTLAFSAGFTMISLLGAQFFKAADNAVLIQSAYCGWPAEIGNIFDVTTPEIKDAGALLLLPARAEYKKCREYTRSCYARADDADISSSGTICDALVMPRIPSTLTMDKACPFPGERVCTADAARIESGLIDSRGGLGINTVDDERIYVRKLMKCAPIDAERWATGWVDGEPWGYREGDKVQGYVVGSLRNKTALGAEYPFRVSLNSLRYGIVPYPL